MLRRQAAEAPSAAQRAPIDASTGSSAAHRLLRRVEAALTGRRLAVPLVVALALFALHAVRPPAWYTHMHQSAALVPPELRAAAACHAAAAGAAAAAAAHPPARAVDTLIFSKDRPLKLFALLESQARHVRGGGGAVTIILRATSLAAAVGYRVVEAAFPGVRFVWQTPALSFQRTTEAALRGLQAPYLMPLVDELVWTRPVDLAAVAGALRRGGDVGTFQLRLGLHLAGIAAARPNIASSSSSSFAAARDTAAATYCYEWTGPDMAPSTFAHPTVLDAGVYPSARLQREWYSLSYGSPNELEFFWYAHRQGYGPGCVHLFYANASVVNNESGDLVRDTAGALGGSSGGDARAVIAANHTAALLAGQRIDVAAFDGLTGPYAHVSVPLRFVPLAPPGCS
jgi:hypothetical protein